LGKKNPVKPYIIMYKSIASADMARLYQYTIISRKEGEVKKKFGFRDGFGAIYKFRGIKLQ